MHADWESVIVGGGVAGLSAALVLGRARRRTLVLDRGGQSNRSAEHIGGLLAQERTPPDVLYAGARDQIGLYPSVAFRDAEAVDVRAEADGFVLSLGDGDEARTQAIVLATGLDYVVPDVPGFQEHWGRAVFHCPFCHGWEVRDRRLAVYAEDAEMSRRLAALLRGWTDDVAVVEPGDVARLRADDGTVQALVLHDGSEVACDGVLVHAPLRLRGDLHERLGLELTEHGLVAIDAFAHTSVPGVYAAGDVAAAPQQVAVALGSGHLAGVVAARELLLGRPARTPA